MRVKLDEGNNKENYSRQRVEYLFFLFPRIYWSLIVLNIHVRFFPDKENFLFLGQFYVYLLYCVCELLLFFFNSSLEGFSLEIASSFCLHEIWPHIKLTDIFHKKNVLK